MKELRLNLKGPLPNNSDLLYGPTGFVYLGIIAFTYGPWNGPLHWINSTSAIFFPENPETCDGFAYSLKPGVSMDYQIIQLSVDGAAGIKESASILLSALLGKLPPP